MKRWLETRQVLERLGALHRTGTPAALATVIRVRGSAYRHEGAKLLVGADGTIVGNVSGGCLEADVREVARRVIETGAAERRSWCGGTDEIAAWDLGVGCEGEVECLIEPVRDDRGAECARLTEEVPFVSLTPLDPLGAGARRVLAGAQALPWLVQGESRIEEVDGVAHFVDVLTPPPRLLVVSAGDDARHLARLAAEVGFRVVVADRRPGLLTSARFAPPIRLVESDAARLGERVVLDAADSAVVMTHHFADDAAYLRALLRSPVRYLGLLGPRSRTARILAAIRGEDPVDEERIFGPVGLDIGTDGAEQVALAVVAELFAVRSGRRPRSLRERSAPIHHDAE
jgi:xanthine/CO dehydrogenase XdhC/CoxF family maturation factor